MLNHNFILFVTNTVYLLNITDNFVYVSYILYVNELMLESTVTSTVLHISRQEKIKKK